MVLLAEIPSDDEFQYDEPTEEVESKEESKDASNSQPKQPRQTKAEAREILHQRRQHKPHASLIVECKKLWEQVRMKSWKKEEREGLVTKLLGLVEGKCIEIIFKHDASRIIQCILKYGTQPQRDFIAEELQPKYVEVSKSQYGKFIISRILALCPKYRSKVIKSFFGNVKKLIRHREASVILEECYTQYASGLEKCCLLEEFYGPEFTLFKTTESRTLSQLISSQPAKEGSIMRHIRETILTILEKCKPAMISSLTLFHRMILSYMKQLSQTVTPENEKRLLDFIEILAEHLIHILHTREGASVAQMCLIWGTPKLRKGIAKGFKGFVKKIAMEQYGFSVLISCFECIDDTVLLKKQILSELFTSPVTTPGAAAGVTTDGSLELGLPELMRDKYCSKVFLYLVLGRVGKYIPGYVLEELKAVDEIRKSRTKKDDETRRSELLQYTKMELVKGMSSDLECFSVLIRCKVGSAVLVEILLAAKGEDGVDKILDQLLLELEKPVDGEEKTFDHAVLNLREKKKREELKEQGVDLSQHMIFCRSSTQALSRLVKGMEGYGLKTWGVLKKLEGFWNIVEGGEKGVGACFLTLACLESAKKAVGSDLEKRLGGFEGLLSQIEGADENVRDDKKKRKREWVGLEKLVKRVKCGGEE